MFHLIGLLDATGLVTLKMKASLSELHPNDTSRTTGILNVSSCIPFHYSSWTDTAVLAVKQHFTISSFHMCLSFPRCNRTIPRLQMVAPWCTTQLYQGILYFKCHRFTVCIFTNDLTDVRRSEPLFIKLKNAQQHYVQNFTQIRQSE
jgi:hypothetical protein